MSRALTAALSAVMATATLTLALQAAPTVDQPGGGEGAPARQHTVTRGDTLWDISKKYYDNPWEWTLVWEANKSFVHNPNLILPDQVLTIPAGDGKKPSAPETVAAAPEENAALLASAVTAEEESAPAETAEEEEALPQPDEAAPFAAAQAPAASPETPAVPAENAAPAEAPAAAYPGGDALIVPRDWEADGVIIGDKEKKLMISQGDTVFLNLGEDQVKPGTQLLVYRKIEKAKDPLSGERLGFAIKQVGRLAVTGSVGSRGCSARVVSSNEPLQAGDAVRIAR